MKKIAKILALSLVCVLAIVALAACGNPVPNTDFASAKTNLEAKGYSTTTSASGLAKQLGLSEEDIVSMLAGSKGEDSAGITMIEVTSEDVAKEAVDAFKKMVDETIKAANDALDEINDALAEAGIEADEETEAEIKSIEAYISTYSSLIVGSSGKIVYAGTKEAINATK